MIEDYEKKEAEKYFGKPYDEIMKSAEKNLKAAGVEEKWIKKILEDGDGVTNAYLNNIPKMPYGGDLWLYMTTD